MYIAISVENLNETHKHNEQKDVIMPAKMVLRDWHQFAAQRVLRLILNGKHVIGEQMSKIAIELKVSQNGHAIR